MGSMNWLGFSLSPHRDEQHHEATAHPADPSSLSLSETQHDETSTTVLLASRLGFSYSGTHEDDCSFDLSTATTCHHQDSSATTPTPTRHHHQFLNHLPPSLGMHHHHHQPQPAFNNIHSQPQDWIHMKSTSSDCSNYNKTSSTSDHLSSSMLMGARATDNLHIENQYHQQPKLENFLGGPHSFLDVDHHHDHQILVEPSTTAATHAPYNHRNINGDINSNSNSSSNIGLSMIKTWLRNQPAAPPQKKQKDDVDGINTNTSSAASAHTLSLSMSTGRAETCSTMSHSNTTTSTNNKLQQLQPIITATATATTTATTSTTPASTNQSEAATSSTTTATAAIEALPKKSIDTFGQRTSIYRGVTRWTGRYEAHLWDNSCRREGQTRKGRQVYLGGYDKEEKAARAYDLAALKYWGTTTTTNFPMSNYEKEIDEMKHMTRQEYVASLRRKSSGFSRGASIYRGVTRHHQHGRWQARIGRVAGNKDLYLGTFSSQEEAAEAYDIAAIKFRGVNAVTNFEMSRYDVKSILESSTLPIGGAAKRLKDVEHQNHHEIVDHHRNRLSSILTSTGDDVDVDKISVMRMLSSMNNNTSSSGGNCEYQHQHQQVMMNDAGAGAGAAAGGWPFNQVGAHHNDQVAFGNGMHYYSSYPYANNMNAHNNKQVWCKQEQDTITDTSTGFYHHQQQQQLLDLGSSHNLYQHSAYLMGSSADSMEHSSGSNCVQIYSTTTATPTSTSTSTCTTDIAFGHGYDNDNVLIGSSAAGSHATTSTSTDNNTDNSGIRSSSYYLPVVLQSSSVGVMRAAAATGSEGYDHDHQVAAFNNWVPTVALPTATTHRSSIHPTFTVWNDTY